MRYAYWSDHFCARKPLQAPNLRKCAGNVHGLEFSASFQFHKGGVRADEAESDVESVASAFVWLSSEVVEVGFRFEVG